MNYQTNSIRPFIGAKDFEISRNFYRDMGFSEMVLAEGFSVFSLGNTSFYLQKAYVKDWIDNTMVFLEVDDLDLAFADLKERNLPEKYEGVRLVPIQNHPWGREFFVHDPSGILWHVGQFFHK